MKNKHETGQISWNNENYYLTPTWVTEDILLEDNFAILYNLKKFWPFITKFKGYSYMSSKCK